VHRGKAEAYAYEAEAKLLTQMSMHLFQHQQYVSHDSSNVITAFKQYSLFRYSVTHIAPRATLSKVPRKILRKFLTLGATDTQVATSSRGYSATVEDCTNRPINSVQQSNRKLCSSSSSSNSSNSSSKIRSSLKIFLGTFKNVAPGSQANQMHCMAVNRDV